ncbi:hypothetical protein ACTHSJ_33675 [Paenibacillus cellulositrophicus]|uniref:hypothetical protein n=1 Tax=Paenibacillus cellulositrophicus TaxID=562959 RepID=UPI003F7DFDA6
MPIAKFELGLIVVTQGVMELIDEVDQMVALNRHANCDWGYVSDKDMASNENGLMYGDRLMSAYSNGIGTEFWVITEADRSSTTLMLPGEY